MASSNSNSQIAFRYRTIDSTTGLTRKTAQRLAQHLGIDETQTIHRALHELASRVLPQYERDDGPLSATQIHQVKQRAKTGPKRSVRSSLFDVRVVYGNSQRTTTLHRVEFSILRDHNPAAFEAAGLSYDTKFDIKKRLICRSRPSGSRYRLQRHLVKRPSSGYCIRH